ncbi:helix-turn-helix transcriptional regulator [Ligaoa zhengdingensis]|uniref:helix-turn-helix transcriptional regulator n=1 Tax=Ligaoa zhengdingensis TaxID=2763658 RepID=UPI0031BB4FE4
MDILEEMRGALVQGSSERLSRILAPGVYGRIGAAERAGCVALLRDLPSDQLKAQPNLCLFLALDAFERGEIPEGRRWQSALAALRDAAPDDSEERRRLDYAVFRLSAQSPQTDNANLLLILAILYNEFLGQPAEYGWLSATDGFPSVLRGAKDLSDWGKNYRAVRSIVKPMLHVLLEDEGLGVCEAAVAELLYEKNCINEASIEVAASLTAAAPEIFFAGMAQLARINRFDPAATPARVILRQLGEQLEQRGAEHLIKNYRALCVRFLIEEGELEPVREWLQHCESDLAESRHPREGYLLTTRARAYIALGRYRDAATLLESVTLMLERGFRPLDTADCLANSAIACELLGSSSLAMEKLERALELTRPYGYIRVFADLGGQMLRLLERLRGSHRAGDPYLAAICAATEQFAQLRPALYAPPAQAEAAPLAEGLTQAELGVLRLIGEGRTNNEVAAAMQIKLTTVKFHMKNIMGKLGAKNRTEAVSIARRQKII